MARQTVAGPWQTGSQSLRPRRGARCCLSHPTQFRFVLLGELRRRSRRSVEDDHTDDVGGQRLGVVGHDHSPERATEQHQRAIERDCHEQCVGLADDIVCRALLVRCGVALACSGAVVGAHPRERCEFIHEVRARPFLNVVPASLEEHGGLSLAPAHQSVLSPVGSTASDLSMEGFAAGSTEGEGLVVSFGSPLEQAATNAKSTAARMAWRIGLRVWASMMETDLRRPPVGNYSDASRRLSHRRDRTVRVLALDQKVMLASLATTPSAGRSSVQALRSLYASPPNGSDSHGSCRSPRRRLRLKPDERRPTTTQCSRSDER